MEKMRFFVDTHDTATETFPAGIGPDQFSAFFACYETACQAEGVVLLQVKVGLEQGRAFCMTMAADAEAVRRAHARVGLSFDSITEVENACPGSVLVKTAPL